MNKATAAVVMAGTLLAGLAAASPALAAQGDSQECSPSTNGGTMVNGVCVLPAMTQGQPAEAFLLNSGGGVDTWTIVSGSIPPGTQMPAEYGAGATIIGGTPTQQGTYTFTVDNVPFTNQGATPSQGTYSITVKPPLALTITNTSPLPSGKVGTTYAQNFFLSGGTEPYTWSVASGTLPPGLKLTTTAAPEATGNQLAGTPTKAGTFSFTMKVSDSGGHQATKRFKLTINS
jgi:Putative Ig domain